MILPRKFFKTVSTRFLPFADAASDGLSQAQLLRLSLFQLSVGMAQVMLLGTLNRVMIVEMGMPATLVALMIAIPVLVAPFRAFLGFRSDNHRSALGWKRVPYLWFGTLYQFGGLAIMPFALIIMSGDRAIDLPAAGYIGSALAFLLTGLGMHMTQTAGLALAADRASEDTRPRVVALLYVMYLVGMAFAALVIGTLLRDFNPLTLVQVVQGAAAMTLVLNLIALWKQEILAPMTKAERAAPRPLFRDAWRDLLAGGDAGRLLAVVFIGTMAFNMQDVLLEPYGGEVMGMTVSATTLLTAMWALGALAGFGLAARWLKGGIDPFRMGARGLLVGTVAFVAVLLAAPMGSHGLFYAGAVLIGLGGGLFAVAMLTAAMALPERGLAGRGLALGAWGAAQATGAGIAILIGGTARDGLNQMGAAGLLGDALASPATGYAAVYGTELVLLFATLIALGPLVRTRGINTGNPAGLRLSDFPT
jgi:MFS transporter, BCD family, chlorophyll transporter